MAARRRVSRQAFAPPPQMSKVEYSSTALGAQARGGNVAPGGLDLVTPSLTLQSGALRDALNYECVLTGGYGRIVGYERVDGQAAPSDASFIIVQVSSFTNVPNVGDHIAQIGSGATGTVAAVVNGPAFYMVLTQVNGVFTETSDPHSLTVDASNSPFTVDASNSPYTVSNAGLIGTAGSLIVTAGNSPFVVDASNSPVIVAANSVTASSTIIGTVTTTTVTPTPQQSAQYTAAAADIYRALIQPVPGSGPVLGVVAMTFGTTDHLYAFRNDGAGNQALLWEAIAGTGWVNIPFFNVVEFTAGGTAVPVDGATLTQGGVTATVKRIMQRTGNDGWTGDAAGGFVITTPAVGNFGAGPATLTGGATVTLSGAPTPIVLNPGGRFEFAKGNFSGQSITSRIYGCDGANRAFEFDGTTLAPIKTGLADDRPQHIAFHKDFLFLSRDSSAIYSAAGLPFRYSAVDGAGEIPVSDTINAMITMPGSQATATLAIYQHQQTSFLYGLDPSTWQNVTYNTGVGGRAYGVQNLFDAFSFDDLGVVTQQTTLAFGNFSSNTLTRAILPFILRQRTKLIASTINRTKGQYRVFFSDGYGLYLTTNNQTYLGAIPVFFPNTVACCDEDKTFPGEEVSYFGSTNGFVYQFEKGPSFDGADLDAYITLAWDAIKSPRVRKRFRAASIEIAGGSYAAISFGYQLGYGVPTITQPGTVSQATAFAPAPTWDVFTWDEFTWDGNTLSPTDVDMTGRAENVQVTIRSSTNYIDAFQVNSVIYHYSFGRGMRV